MKRTSYYHNISILSILAVLIFLVLPAIARVQVGDYFPAEIDTPNDYIGSDSPREELIWSCELSHPGATYLAMHFVDFELGPGDYLIVSDPVGNQIYTMQGKGKMQAGTFWAQHVKGDTVILQLIAVSENGGSGFSIDQYVAGFEELSTDIGIEAICGTDDKGNAACYQMSHPNEYQHAKAVARLLINGGFLCTGWLASPDNYLITNEHCIETASEALNTDYEFMAEAPDCNSPNCQLCYPGTVFSGATLIQNDYDLDYALVQINSGNPAASYGYLRIDDREAVIGEQIYIPQHPAGRAKELAIYSTHPSDTGGVCRVLSLTEPPCSGSGYDVGYYADTEGGSSGSPVLATSSHKVIALHHCADCPNRGVPINLIYPEIKDYVSSPSTDYNDLKVLADNWLADNLQQWTAELVGLWQLDESGGTAASDSSGNDHDGTLFNGPLWQSSGGRFGGALSFDEVDDYLEIPDFNYTNGADEFTLCFWFKIDDATGSYYQYMFSHGNWNTNNSLNVYLRESSASSPNQVTTNITLDDGTQWQTDTGISLEDGQWHMYAITVSSIDGAEIFIDANSIGTSIGLKGTYDPTSNIHLGCRSDYDIDRFFGHPAATDGLLDDIRIYNYALSSDDIQLLYGGSEPPAPPPVFICIENPPGDQNADCKINFLDYALLVNNWLASSP